MRVKTEDLIVDLGETVENAARSIKDCYEGYKRGGHGMAQHYTTDLDDAIGWLEAAVAEAKALRLKVQMRQGKVPR